MRKLQHALLLSALCIAGGQARAGLFSDGEELRQLGTRVAGLEESGKQQAEINKQQAEAAARQSRSLLDLQSQMDAQNSELRTIRGQNEELGHGLQDAEKRQKDFYIDLDTRLRHIEDVQEKAAAAAAAAPVIPPGQTGATGDAADDDPAVENRTYEAAYKLFKDVKFADAISAFQDFLNKFPDSVYIPNVHYVMGDIYLAQQDFKNALRSFQLLIGKYSYSPKTPDAMLKIADCQGELGDKAAARKTLKQVIAKYPGSDTATEAKSRLATLK